jgi:hypothetical protein
LSLRVFGHRFSAPLELIHTNIQGPSIEIKFVRFKSLHEDQQIIRKTPMKNISLINFDKNSNGSDNAETTKLR